MSSCPVTVGLRRLWPKSCGAWKALGQARRHAAKASNCKYLVSEDGNNVYISKARLDELMDSEVVHFARSLKQHPITLQQILALRDIDSYRRFLLEELPIRYARRLTMVEGIPGWKGNHHLRTIHKLYGESFRRLRLFNNTDAYGFRALLANIKMWHSDMLMHVVHGTRDMKNAGALDDEQANQFLRNFLTARIGTDIMSAQYLALTKENPDGPGLSSVIDPDCDPVAVVSEAAQEAAELCHYHHDQASPIDIVSTGPIRFPFIPQYLTYIMLELLKNALRASVERYGDKCGEHPIRVVICGDESVVVIRVSDTGGGIPMESMDRVWSYLFTTAEKQVKETGADYADAEEAPLAGFGCGLPLSRNYANYAGGRLELNTMPHHGVDAYLYLNAIGNAQELVVEPSLPTRDFLPPDDNSPRRKSGPFLWVRSST